MSDHQDHPRHGGDAGTERDLTAEVQALRADVDALAARLEHLPTAQQIANLSGDLRAHLADALGGLDGDTVLRELAALRAQLGTEHGTVVEQLQDNLADVASGEVVGALWDEVRAMRAELDTATAAPDTAQAEPQLGGLADELASLRAELAEGLVVEPSDALSSSLDALRAEVDGLRDSLGELRTAPQPAAAAPEDSGRDEELVQRLDALQSGLDDVRARLDEGLVLADDAELPAPPAGDTAGLDGGAVAELRDEIRAAGAIPDQVIDALREELKALRRRIAVKASERVLDDEQLAQIADAVAARLAQDQGQA